MKLIIINLNKILNHSIQLDSKILIFNEIQNYPFKFNSKLNNWISFKIIYFNEIIKLFYETALYFAIYTENIDIIKLLLENDKIDVNVVNILIMIFSLYD